VPSVNNLTIEKETLEKTKTRMHGGKRNEGKKAEFLRSTSGFDFDDNLDAHAWSPKHVTHLNNK
jgi:hypothetical protein